MFWGLRWLKFFLMAFASPSQENVEGKEGSAGKEERTSVSFMCNDDVGLPMQEEKNQAQSAVVSGVSQAQRAQGQDVHEQNSEDDKGKERGGKGGKEGPGGKRSNGAGAVTKRKREQEKPMEQVDAEIDRRIVKHEDLWAYSAMKEGEPEGDANGRRNKGKNPWLWSKKVICKITGYQQWWPLFSDYVHRKFLRQQPPALSTPTGPSFHIHNMQFVIALFPRVCVYMYYLCLHLPFPCPHGMKSNERPSAFLALLRFE